MPLLTETHDEYTVQLERQNNGLPCTHCNAPQGHFKFCPLICRETAEARSAIAGGRPQDKIIAHGLGVAL